jgi:hypothetical protein
MGLFGKKESPTDEFLHLYVTLNQYRGWTYQHVPPAFRQGITEAAMQQELRVWASENGASLDYLDQFRRKVIAYQVSKSDLKRVIAQIRELIAQADERLQKKGRS